MRLKDRIQLRINMNELIKVDINENQEPVISGRELHKANDRGRLIWN